MRTYEIEYIENNNLHFYRIQADRKELINTIKYMKDNDYDIKRVDRVNKNEIYTTLNLDNIK